MEKKKFMVVVTHATDDQDRANLSMAFVAAMIAEDIDVEVLFMFEGVLLAKKGMAETIAGRNMTPLNELMPIITGAGITMYGCGPCLKTHGVSEDEMLEGVKIITAPTAVHAMTDREVVTF